MPRPPALHEYIVINAGVTDTPSGDNFPLTGIADIQALEAQGWEVVNLSFGDGWGGPASFGVGAQVYVFLRREL